MFQVSLMWFILGFSANYQSFLHLESLSDALIVFSFSNLLNTSFFDFPVEMHKQMVYIQSKINFCPEGI